MALPSYMLEPYPEIPESDDLFEQMQNAQRAAQLAREEFGGLQDQLRGAVQDVPVQPQQVSPLHAGIAGGLALLGGGLGARNAGSALERYLGTKREMNEAKLRERQAKAQQKIQALQLQLDQQFQKYQFAEKDVAQLRREEERKADAAKDKVAKAWTAYQGANLPGEKSAAARRLRVLDPEFAPTDDDVAEDIRKSKIEQSQKAIAGMHAIFKPYLDQFGELTPEDREALVQSMKEFAKNAGIEFELPVPEAGRKTVKATDLEEKRKLAEKRFDWQKTYQEATLDEREDYHKSLVEQAKANGARADERVEQGWANYRLRVEKARDAGAVGNTKAELAQLNNIVSSATSQENKALADIAEAKTALEGPNKDAASRLIAAREASAEFWKARREEAQKRISQITAAAPNAEGGTEKFDSKGGMGTPQPGPDHKRIKSLKSQFESKFPGGKVEIWSGKPRLIQGTSRPSKHNTGEAADLRGPDLAGIAKWASSLPGAVVIYNRSYWKNGRRSGSYSPNGDPHTDHVHVEFSGGNGRVASSRKPAREYKVGEATVRFYEK